ncbi:hypothetical protein KP509_08G031500 [Ceratopteris richardii]|uniref:TIR domain-containing protein n=1 Tax=Ceratopteris richardii TaxID=49495 RepID=A0A8T2UBG0_CERRI|nr:hypothetical protein KP509_08G031500 [Ceratopteris richardii]
MSQKYDVFLCHRGPDTKRNFVSVLSGMLRSKGISCFVDYRMHKGEKVNCQIDSAIQSSRVFIVILSPKFATSTWCLEELLKIMKMEGIRGTPNPPVVPVFYDVDCNLVQQQEANTSYDLSGKKERHPDKIESWSKALKDVGGLDGFIYESGNMLQWEISEEIVAKVESYLSHNMVVDQRKKTRILMGRLAYDVFICHWRLDTQLKAVSVLRGILLSRGITPLVIGYGKNDGESESMCDVLNAIKSSKVHVIFLSPNFASSKQCLEELVHIMNTQDSTDVFPKPTVLPIFYDVEPSTVRHQQTDYDLKKIPGSTEEERERWASALCQVSLLHGSEYKTDSKYQFQWETLYDIVKNVEACTRSVIPWNDGPYVEKINQVLKVLEVQEKSDHVSVVGIYGSNKSELANILVKRLGREFGRVCHLTNVMEKACQRDGVSNIVEKVSLDLIQSDDVRICQQRLANERCLVMLEDLGNDIERMKNLLEEVKAILRNGSLLVLANQFQHMLQELNVPFIVTLEHERGILNICYAEADRINEDFLIHLRETFHMLGLDVHLLNKDQLMSDRTRLEDAKVIVCIISRTFSNGDLKSMFPNADIRSKIIHISYGSYPSTDESIPEPLFKMEIDFERKELDKGQFRKMVNTVVQTLQRHKEIMEPAVDFPVGLAGRSSDIVSYIQDCVAMSGKSLQCFGLVGMGGAGKTTLAMSIYNKIHSKFEGSFFSVNTRAEVQDKGRLGLVAVQKRILANLLRSKEDVTINDEVHGKAVLSKKLNNVIALVILDDVDDERHLDALYKPLQSSLGAKSVVIITTRDRKILESAEATKTFDIEGLGKEMSKWLFNWHAFMRPKPPVELEEVSERVIEACNGLPLALKVVGSHLYNVNDKPCWEESFTYLQKNNSKIFDVLRISFDGLQNDEKEVFLDICCFLIDEGEDLACAVLNACYGMGRTYLHELESKCLVSTYVDYDENNWLRRIEFDYDENKRVRRIRVHDLLRDMGRWIIRRERRDRAWDEETTSEILQDERARASLRGLSIRGDSPLPVEASHSGWLPRLNRGVGLGHGPTCLPHLRILVVKHDFRKPPSTKRRLCPRFFFKNVRCGELRWLRWESAPFEQLPRGLRSTKLGVVELPGSDIRELRMATLPKLEHLNLRSCEELKALGSSIGMLIDLKYLNLFGCDRIKSLPTDMTSLSSLEHLKLSSYHKLDCKGFSSLQTLKLSNCRGLEQFDCKGLSSLQDLRVGITCLKRIAGEAPSLQRLELRGCEGLQDLDCKGFPSLQHLKFVWCCDLKRIPGDAPSLQILELRNCWGLEELDCKGLSFLQDLRLGNTCLKRIAGEAPSLQRLELRDCEGLQELDCKGLSSLQHLQFIDCHKLTRIAGDAPSLQRLELSHCEGLEELDCKGLSSLQYLKLCNCHKLKRIAGEAPSLQRLELSHLEGLEELDCKGLPSLEVLKLHICESLKTLCSLPTTLQKLRLSYCKQLESVDVSGCTCLRRVSIDCCNRLTHSNIRGWDRLRRIRAIPKFESTYTMAIMNS